MTGEDKVTITKVCPWCSEPSVTEVDRFAYELWQSGELIQRVWPKMTASDRELLITGTHDACWQAMFKEED